MRRRSALLIAASTLTAPTVVRAQRGPPLRMIVPFAPGGASDTTARLIQPGLSAALGRPVVIENRSGASDMLGAELMMRAPPDGSVVGISNTSPHGIVPLATANPLYDADRDFTHIAMVADTPTVLLAPGASPFRDFPSLLSAARGRPAGLTYASSGVGGLQHLQGELMAKVTGARFVHVPYRGTGPALQALISGETDCLLTPLAGTTGAIAGGQVRALAVSTATPFAPLPGVPTYAQLGFPQLTATSWTGLSGPRGLPAGFVGDVHAATAVAMSEPGLAERLAAAGLYPPERPVSSAEYQALHAEFARVWGPVVREARITVE